MPLLAPTTARGGAADELERKRKELNQWLLQNPKSTNEEFRAKQKELKAPVIQNFKKALNQKANEIGRREAAREKEKQKAKEHLAHPSQAEVERLQKAGKLPADLKRASKEAGLKERPSKGGSPGPAGLGGLKTTASPRPLEPSAGPTRTGPVLDGSNIPKEITFEKRAPAPSPSPSPGLVLDGKDIPSHLEFLSRPPASPTP